MRRLHEETANLRVEHLDGLKIHTENGWALVLPDVSAPLFRVQAESSDPKVADALVAQYGKRIEELQGEI
jgi:mannose-1-phosphate guanylyltransferase/phosphomannomutase